MTAKKTMLCIGAAGLLAISLQTGLSRLLAEEKEGEAKSQLPPPGKGVEGKEVTLVGVFHLKPPPPPEGGEGKSAPAAKSGEGEKGDKPPVAGFLQVLPPKDGNGPNGGMKSGDAKSMPAKTLPAKSDAEAGAKGGEGRRPHHGPLPIIPDDKGNELAATADGKVVKVTGVLVFSPPKEGEEAGATAGEGKDGPKPPPFLKVTSFEVLDVPPPVPGEEGRPPMPPEGKSGSMGPNGGNGGNGGNPPPPPPGGMKR